jgi:hypothetical protein
MSDEETEVHVDTMEFIMTDDEIKEQMKKHTRRK